MFWKRLFRFSISGCGINVKKKNQRRRSQTNLSYSNSERTDLKSHLVRKHGMDKGNALGMKSQLGMYKIKKRKPDHLRKTKPRFYQRKSCAYPGCLKVRYFWWYLILRCKEDPLKWCYLLAALLTVSTECQFQYIPCLCVTVISSVYCIVVTISLEYGIEFGIILRRKTFCHAST